MFGCIAMLKYELNEYTWNERAYDLWFM